ncbi:MAG: hypothetical protein R2770_02060 [Acidimicrobiales bacterium]
MWFSGAVSDLISVPNSSPSRTLSTATPWAPMGPDTTIESPGVMCRGEMSTPAGTTPTPEVLM